MMSFFSPLSHFCSDVDYYQVSRHLEICHSPYNLRDVDRERFIAGYEIESILNCKLWLRINDSFPHHLKPSVICNTFLLSLWVCKPHQVRIMFRFGDNNTFVRLLSRFEFNKLDNNGNEFPLSDLDQVKKYYNSFSRITRRNKRLYIAELNTFRGCQAHHWVVAFLLFTAAFEALLNYEDGPGVTKRLSKTIACLIESRKKERDIIYKRFNHLYNIRSDIMHGRQRRWQRGDKNLQMLSELTSLLRRLWQRILADKKLQATLEGDDKTRKVFFKQNQDDYSAPSLMQYKTPKCVRE